MNYKCTNTICFYRVQRSYNRIKTLVIQFGQSPLFSCWYRRHFVLKKYGNLVQTRNLLSAKWSWSRSKFMFVGLLLTYLFLVYIRQIIISGIVDVKYTIILSSPEAAKNPYRPIRTAQKSFLVAHSVLHLPTSGMYQCTAMFESETNSTKSYKVYCKSWLFCSGHLRNSIFACMNDLSVYCDRKGNS